MVHLTGNPGVEEAVLERIGLAVRHTAVVQHTDRIAAEGTAVAASHIVVGGIPVPVDHIPLHIPVEHILEVGRIHCTVVADMDRTDLAVRHILGVQITGRHRRLHLGLAVADRFVWPLSWL